MQTEERFLDFGFEKWPAYLNSPVRHVVEHRKLCRWRLDDGEPLPFPVLEEHRSAGYVDYAIAPMIFSDGRVNAVSWATDRPGGFSDADLRLFEEVLPTYSTIVEVKSLRRFATRVLSVRRQHVLDRISGMRKGGFLAHRSQSRSEDETEIRDSEDAVRTSHQRDSASDAQTLFG
jgi:hypothetical protein